MLRLYGLLSLIITYACADKINFIVFYDASELHISEAITAAEKKFKNDGDEIGKIYSVALDIHTNYTKVSEDWEEWTKSEEPPSFVLDFTVWLSTSVHIRHLSRMLRFPTVSTSLPHPSFTNPVNMEWNQLTKNEKHYLVQVRSPENMILDSIINVAVNAGAYRSHIQHGNISYALDYFQSANKIAAKRVIGIGHSVLGRLISDLKSTTVFVYGTPDEIRSVLQDASTYTKDLFNERTSWWIFSTDINATFKCPDFVHELMTFTLKLNKTEVDEKVMHTMNVTTLYITDLVWSTVRAVSNMKKNKEWVEPKYQNPEEYDNNLLKNLNEELKKDINVLGVYTLGKIGNTLVSQPNVHFEMDLITPSNTTSVGLLKTAFKTGSSPLEVKNFEAWNHHLPIEYLNATVVLDARFVMRDEKCFETKEKTDESLKCYSGFVIDVLKKIMTEIKIFKIFVKAEEPYGSTRNKKHWTGASGSLSTAQNLKKDRQIGIGAFDTNLVRRPNLKFSFPFFTNGTKSYGFAFAKNTHIDAVFNKMIFKLKNQRYLEQLKEVWFVEYITNVTTTWDN